MATYNTSARLRDLGTASLIFGLIGLAFFWWTPFGIVFSLAGLVLGLVGWVLLRPGGASLNLAIGGFVLSLLALVLDLVIAGLGDEIIKMTSR